MLFNRQKKNEFTYKNLSPEWQICFGLSRSAFMQGSLPIGCLVTDKYGGFISRASAKMVYGSAKSNMTQHAEMVALSQIPLTDLEQKLILYTTVEPCPMCFGGINVARIAELNYGTRDPWAGSTDLHDGNWYMRWKHLEIKRASDEFERLFACWLVYAMMKKKDGDGFCDLNSEFVERWKIVVPDVLEVLPRLLALKLESFDGNDEELFNLLAEETK
jgi:tRNA(Arg) A34 adenosine deaminase TadA